MNKTGEMKEREIELNKPRKKERKKEGKKRID